MSYNKYLKYLVNGCQSLSKILSQRSRLAHCLATHQYTEKGSQHISKVVASAHNGVPYLIVNQPTAEPESQSIITEHNKGHEPDSKPRHYPKTDGELLD